MVRDEREEEERQEVEWLGLKQGEGAEAPWNSGRIKAGGKNPALTCG